MTLRRILPKTTCFQSKFRRYVEVSIMVGRNRPGRCSFIEHGRFRLCGGCGKKNVARTRDGGAGAFSSATGWAPARHKCFASGHRAAVAKQRGAHQLAPATL